MRSKEAQLQISLCAPVHNYCGRINRFFWELRCDALRCGFFQKHKHQVTDLKVTDL
jgi:hypothetical protein